MVEVTSMFLLTLNLGRSFSIRSLPPSDGHLHYAEGLGREGSGSWCQSRHEPAHPPTDKVSDRRTK